MNFSNRLKFAVMETCYSLILIAAIVTYPILIACAILFKLTKFMQNLNRNKSIKNQIAVVTGSGRGLGRLLAIELAKRGCHVAVVDIQQDLAEQTALYISQQYQVKAKAYKVDVSDYQQLVELNKNVSHDLGDITILINNAAILTLSSVVNPPPEEIKQMINVNFTAVCLTQEVFLPKMKSLNQGHIVNICSLGALMTLPPVNIYCGTKSAVRSITSALRMHIMSESKNISAMTVMPTFLNTNLYVERLAHKIGFTKLLPLIEGHLVAHHVVESMLNHEDEITIPSAFLYCYKLTELLPISLKESVSSFCISKFLDLKRLDKLLKK